MDKKFLSESVGKLIDIKQDIEALAEEFDTVVNELQDAFDEKSEKYQESENGEKALNKIDDFGNVKDTLESLVEEVNDLVDSVGELNA